jgi:hypothetical protein
MQRERVLDYYDAVWFEQKDKCVAVMKSLREVV